MLGLGAKRGSRLNHGVLKENGFRSGGLARAAPQLSGPKTGRSRITGVVLSSWTVSVGFQPAVLSFCPFPYLDEQNSQPIFNLSDLAYY